MWRNWRGASLFVALALLACGSEKVTEPSVSTEPQIIVSAPIPRASLPGGEGSSGSVVFVSATPRAVPGAVQATIAGEAGHSANTSMRDGGFDPVSVPGIAGDRFQVAITDSAGNKTTVAGMAKQGVRPRVVRTSPAPRKTDVPLNAVIRVVFSSPVDLESARAGIQLLTGSGDAVPGTVEAVGLLAVDYVVTGGSLAPETAYRLEVANGVRDVLGQALAEPLSVEFRTGSAEVVPGTLALMIDPERIDLVPGATGHAEITITRGGAFTGTVSLLENVAPAGLGVRFSNFIDPGTTTATVIVAVDAGVAAGTRTVVISAVSADNSALTAPATATLTVVVGAPSGSVSLDVDPAMLIAAAGGTDATTTIAIRRTAPFAGPVDVTVIGAPSWATATLEPGVAAGATSVLSVSAAPGAENGIYTLTLVATGAGVADALATVNFMITEGATPAFVFNPESLVVTAGGASASSVLTLTRPNLTLGGRGLNLYLSGGTSGLTAGFTPITLRVTDATLTVRAGPAVAPGTYLLRVTGETTTGGIPMATAAIPVVVSAAPALRR